MTKPVEKAEIALAAGFSYNQAANSIYFLYDRRGIMKLDGVCLTTDNAPRLAEFYKIVLQKEPFIEGNHYGFGNIAIWNPGDANAAAEKNIWLQCFDEDIDSLYERLLREIPNIKIISPPERKPWGAYSFWFADPDGNKTAVAQQNNEK